jgi:hypothetical protein
MAFGRSQSSDQVRNVKAGPLGWEVRRRDDPNATVVRLPKPLAELLSRRVSWGLFLREVKFVGAFKYFVYAAWTAVCGFGILVLGVVALSIGFISLRGDKPAIQFIAFYVPILLIVLAPGLLLLWCIQRLWIEPANATMDISEGRCGACNHPLPTSAQAGGCAVCTECGAAWQLTRQIAAVEPGACG